MPGLRVGVLTDVHVVQDVSRRASWHNAYDFAGAQDRLVAALDLLARERVELVLWLGDLAHDGDLPSLRRVLRRAATGPRALAVGGNHDGPRPTRALAQAAEGGVRLPGWRAVRAGVAEIRVAGVRIARRAERRWVAARPPALTTWGAAPVLLASHFPLLSRVKLLTQQRLPYAGDLVDRAAVAESIRARSGPTVAVSGHLHVRDSTASGPLLQLACGAMIEPPFEATVVELRRDGNSLVLQRAAHELGSAPERRNPRLVPAEETWRFRPRQGWRHA